VWQLKVYHIYIYIIYPFCVLVLCIINFVIFYYNTLYLYVTKIYILKIKIQTKKTGILFLSEILVQRGLFTCPTFSYPTVNLFGIVGQLNVFMSDITVH